MTKELCRCQEGEEGGLNESPALGEALASSSIAEEGAGRRGAGGDSYAEATCEVRTPRGRGPNLEIEESCPGSLSPPGEDASSRDGHGSERWPARSRRRR